MLTYLQLHPHRKLNEARFYGAGWFGSTVSSTLLGCHLQVNSSSLGSYHLATHSSGQSWAHSARIIALSPYHKLVQLYCCNISPWHRKGLYFLPLRNPSNAGSLFIFHISQMWQSFPPALLSKDYLLENTAKVLNPPYEFRDKYMYLWGKNPIMQ